MAELNANTTILQKTCVAIGEYYKLMGKLAVYYSRDSDTPNIGKFSKWFEGEELDVADLENDFRHIDECLYLNFDQHFPFTNNIKTHKEDIQFLIMQYCFYNFHPPTINQINGWYSNFQSKKHKNKRNTPKHTYITEEIKYNDVAMPIATIPTMPVATLKRCNSTDIEFAAEIFSISFKPRQKAIYRGNTPLLPDLLEIHKSKSYVTDDIDLQCKAEITYSKNDDSVCDNADIRKCKQFENMKVYLNTYTAWITRKKKTKNSQNKGIYQICYENNWKITDILRAFYHIIYAHNDTFDEMFEELQAKETNAKHRHKCDVLKCKMVARNYREKERMAMDFNRSKMYFGFKASQEVNMQQLFDKIHCHLYHSYDLGLRIHKKKLLQQNNNLLHIKNILNKKKKTAAKIYNKLNFNKYKLEYKQEQKQDQEQSENDVFIFGEQCYFDEAHKNHTFYVRAKHNDLKQEMLCNITKYQWRDLYYKARAYLNVICDKDYEIQHLLSCMIYCNYGKCLDIQTYSNNYAHLNRLIAKTIELCNVPDSISFYICLHREIAITPSTIINFNTLVSLTSNSIVALNFSGSTDGISLALLPKNESTSKYFDCRFISDFGNEYEILCTCTDTPMSFQIENIVDVNVASDYSMYVILIKILDSIFLDIKPIATKLEQPNNSNAKMFADYIAASLDRFCSVRTCYTKQNVIDLLLHIYYLPEAITKYSRGGYDAQRYTTDPCQSFVSCECLMRIVHILKIYQTLLNSPYWLKLPILPFVTFNANGMQYNLQQIVSDFSHILSHHQREVIAGKITVFDFVENEISLQCKYREKTFANKKSYKVCVSFDRHCRNKSNRDLEKDQYLEAFYSANDNFHAKDIENELDIESELEKIHTFFLHSLCKYNLIPNINEKEFQQRKNLIQESQRDRIRYRGQQVDDVDDADQEYLTNNLLNNKKNQENKDYFHVKPLGKFYFQSIPESQRCLNHIKPTFSNIKEEVLQNKLQPLTVVDWNEVLRKSKKQTTDWNRKKHKVTYTKAATLTQIMTIKLYTDYDKLQHELKKSFRIIPEKLRNRNKWNIVSEMETLRVILSNFYHWRASMISTIEDFQDFISYECLYHGVNPAMILSPLNSLSTFWGPLSSTTNKHVASTFATNKGMVIQFCSKYPRSNFCYQFDASIISDYPEENERIIGFMYCRIRMVYSEINNLQHFTVSDLDRTNKRFTSFARLDYANNRRNLQIYMNWYYFTLRLFTKGIYSMSAQIEPFFIEILNKTVAFIKQFNIKKISDVNRYKDNILNKNVCILVCHLVKYLFHPSKKQIIYLGDISVGLQEYFLQNAHCRNDKNWIISYSKLLSLFPNLECIYLYNHFAFNENVLKDTITWLTHNKQIQIIKYIYFDYKRPSDVIPNVRLSIKVRLNSIGWSLKQKRLKNDTGYTIRLKCDNFKIC